MDWVFWAMAGAAVLHVAEEYLFGWLAFTRGLEGRFVARFAAGIDLAAFIIVNALFVLLCVAGALVGMRQPFFSLSIAVLLLINTVMHLVPMAVVRRYSPGSATAIFLYVPLAVYAFYVVDEAGELSALTAVGAFLLCLLWMSLPVGAAFIRSARGEP
ncbi:MAG: HXXEE domain-containing protein [Actinobacteria bacterium]|nr:HXXEE domain-containing protein [Actinomycetota bacterium]